MAPPDNDLWQKWELECTRHPPAVTDISTVDVFSHETAQTKNNQQLLRFDITTIRNKSSGVNKQVIPLDPQWNRSVVSRKSG